MAVTTYTTIDRVIVHEDRNGVQRNYRCDTLGSTVTLTDATTTTDTMAYWPFGEIRSRTGTNSTSFLYVGTRGYYASSALIYVRARHYGQKMGRWMTVDPNWPRSEAYSYVNNRVTSFIDPTGRIIVGLVLAARDWPGGQAECLDLLCEAPDPDLGKDLLKCLAEAGDNPDKVGDCFLEFGTGISTDAILKYLACLASRGVGVVGLGSDPGDPCNPRTGNTCYACCWSKYLVCMGKCLKEKGDACKAFRLLLCYSGSNRGGKDGGLTACQEDCDTDFSGE